MSISMGNIKKQPLLDIMQGEAYKKFKALLREQGVVEGCNRCGWIRPLDHFLDASPLSPYPKSEVIARTQT